MFLWSPVNLLFPSKDSFSSLSWLKHHHVKGGWVPTTCITNGHNITELCIHSLWMNSHSCTEEHFWAAIICQALYLELLSMGVSVSTACQDRDIQIQKGFLCSKSLIQIFIRKSHIPKCCLCFVSWRVYLTYFRLDLAGGLCSCQCLRSPSVPGHCSRVHMSRCSQRMWDFQAFCIG